MGDAGPMAELPYEPLPYRDLWPVVEELLPPLSRHDADADHLGAVARSDALLSTPARSDDASGRPDTLLCTPGRPDTLLGTPGRPDGLLCTPGRPDTLLCTPGRSDALLGVPGRPDTLLCTPSRSDALLGTPGRPDTLLDAPHLLLDVAGFAGAGELDVVERDGTLNLTFGGASEPEPPAARDDARAVYGSVGNTGGRMVLRFRLVDDAGQPVSGAACQLCHAPVELFRAHEHTVQGRLVLSTDCVTLEVGAVASDAAHSSAGYDLHDVPVSLSEAFPSPTLPVSEPEVKTLEHTISMWAHSKCEQLNTPQKYDPLNTPQKSEQLAAAPVEHGLTLPDDAACVGLPFEVKPVPAVSQSTDANLQSMAAESEYADPDDPFPPSQSELPASADVAAAEPSGAADKQKPPYQCTTCLKSFNSRRVLNKHKVIHSGVRHACDQCDKTFGRLDRLQRHQVTHSQRKQHVCTTCGKAFFRREYLLQHQASVHEDEQPFQCDVCGMRFALLSNFSRHKFVHTDKKPYQCEECGRGFIRLDHLEAHKQQHTGRMPLVCHHCGLQYASQDRLDRHMRVHESAMFHCTVCPRQFHRKDKLSQHMVVHHSERSALHACALCPRVLARADLLRQHTRQHAQPDNRQCPVCFKFFAGETRYEAHVQSHHKVPQRAAPSEAAQHSCSLCTKVFRRRSTLEAHEKKVHSVSAALSAAEAPADRAAAAAPGGRPGLPCPRCRRTFSRQQTLRAHVSRARCQPADASAAPTAAAAAADDDADSLRLLTTSDDASLDGACADAASLTQNAYQMLSFSAYSF